MSFFGGALLVLLAGYQLYRGKISSVSEGGATSAIRRSEKPVLFWLVLLFELAVAAVLLLGLIHF
jgi:hypothetical protein